MEWSGRLNLLTSYSGERKNCFLCWHQRTLHICLIVWPLENRAGNIMVQYALRNFSRAFILFCEMTFTYSVFCGVFLGMFGQIIFFPLLFECKCVCLRRSVESWPRDSGCGVCGCRFSLSYVCPRSRVNPQSVCQSRLWSQTVLFSAVDYMVNSHQSEELQ